MPPRPSFLLRRLATLPHSCSSTSSLRTTCGPDYRRPAIVRLTVPQAHLPRPSLRALSTTAPRPRLPSQLPPRRKILDNEITESFLHGSGPGGQKINKTSSAVQLKHLPTGIVVKCQETRSRSQNRKLARQILGEKIEELEKGEGSRVRLKAREKSRKKASGEKKRRRKYRRLAEGREGEGEDGVDEDVDVDVDVDEGLQAEGGEATEKLRDGERQGEAHIKGG